MQAPPPPNPKRILADLGLRPKKAWGQNFLRDQNILRILADAAAPPGTQTVVELGAGLGALTHYLAQVSHQVWAVERDRELAPILAQTLAWAPHVEVLESDAAKLDWPALRHRAGQMLYVAGNLPYQISSRILVSLADEAAHVARAVLMVQREVAERAAVAPGQRGCGLLSALLQRSMEVRILRQVPPQAFLPPPKVQSAVLVLQPRAAPVPADLDAVFRCVVRAAFSQRRKTLKNALASSLGMRAAEIGDALAEAHIDSVRRAESLALEELMSLARVFAPRLCQDGNTET